VGGVTRNRWFLPGQPDLVALLARQAATTTAAMHDLVAWTDGDTTAAERVRGAEHEADEQKRLLWRQLRDAFSPPMDAEDLFTLSADLDEVLNAAKDLVREAEVMRTAPDAASHDMAVLLAEAVGHLEVALTRLGEHDDADATGPADAAIKAQRRLERVYRAAMSALLDSDDVALVMARREIYRRFSRIGDVTHRVAERVWYAVVKEA
jgi:uncharacterized protein Yka (UPF0111/DUF47 family)